MAQDTTRLKFEQVCSDCQSSDFVEDHAQGDLICTVSLPQACAMLGDGKISGLKNLAWSCTGSLGLRL